MGADHSVTTCVQAMLLGAAGPDFSFKSVHAPQIGAASARKAILRWIRIICQKLLGESFACAAPLSSGSSILKCCHHWLVFAGFLVLPPKRRSVQKLRWGWRELPKEESLCLLSSCCEWKRRGRTRLQHRWVAQVSCCAMLCQ